MSVFVKLTCGIMCELMGESILIAIRALTSADTYVMCSTSSQRLHVPMFIYMHTLAHVVFCIKGVLDQC